MMNYELDWLKKWNLYSPNSIAIKDGISGREFTYGQCYRNSIKLAAQLRSKFALKKGDTVAILSTNNLEYILLFFALIRIGAVMVPINFRLTSREITHILKDSKAKLLFYEEAFSKVIEEIDPQHLPKQAEILSESKGFVPESLSIEADEIEMEACEADPIMILYTSGTTGAPKGAIISHRMIFWNSMNTSLRLNLTQQDKTIIFLPFFHTGAWNVLTTPLLHRGGQIIFLPKFDAEPILRLCEQEKTSILFGVPTTMEMLAQAESFKNTDLSSIRYAIVGGEPMSRNLIETWHHKGIPIRQGYGLTEFGPNVFSLNEEDAIRKIGSIGFPNFYIQVRVVDNNGHDVPQGQIGELILKGPSCMEGYWNNPKATEETIKDGWLHTGDLVQQDEDGYFYVSGRKKEMFISGGENVYPIEIEQVLSALPQVKEVAVVGVRDSTWGEVGRAYVAFKEPNHSLSEKELQEYCLKNLAKFKVPKSFHVLPELPKGDSGKILKRKLIEL